MRSSLSWTKARTEPCSFTRGLRITLNCGRSDMISFREFGLLLSHCGTWRTQEIHGDKRLHFDDLAIEAIRTVAPLLDRFECGAAQDERTGNQFQLLYAAVLSHQ